MPLSSPELQLVSREPLTGVIVLTWSQVSPDPAVPSPVVYELHRNGVLILETEGLEYTETMPIGNYVYSVRATQDLAMAWDTTESSWDSDLVWDGTGEQMVSPWDSLLVRIPDPDEIVGNPDIDLIVDGVVIPCENVLADIRIVHGTQSFTPTPTPVSAAVTLHEPTQQMVDSITVGSEVTIRVNDLVRAFGRVTDLTIHWPESTITQMDLSIVGPLEHLGWNTWIGLVPQETDRQRMVRLLTYVYGAQSWTADLGALELIREHEYKAPTGALTGAEDITRSTQTRLVELPNGTIRWMDRWSRVEAGEQIIDACYVSIGSKWGQASEDIVNRAIVFYGPEPAEGQTERASATTEVAVTRPWERRSVTVNTELVDHDDAKRYADRLVNARKERVYKQPAVEIPIHKTPWRVAWPLVRDALIGLKLTIENWPPPVPQETVTGYIEGWTERLGVNSEGKITWAISYSLSDPTLSPIDEYPVNLTATALTPTSIRLDWNEGNPRVHYWEVYAMPHSIYLVTVEVPTQTWTDTEVLMGQTYTYEIRGYDLNWNLIQKSNQATATTPTVGAADPVRFTYAQAHNGACRLYWDYPSADPDFAHARFTILQGRWPENPDDGYIGNVGASGQGNWGGPGITDRGDQTWYIRFWSVNKLGQVNTSAWAQTSVFFLRSPVEFWPSVRNAYGVTYGWENQNRTRAGNTSSNTYRYIWCYGTQINDVMQGRKCTSIHVLMHRAGDGPGGTLQPRVGLHKYTSLPGGRPTIDGVQGWGGAFPRNYGDWVQISTDWGDQLSQAAGGYRGPGGGYDALDVNQTWVGQPASNDGVLHFRHCDFA